MVSVSSSTAKRLFVAADTYLGVYDQDEGKWLVQFPLQCYRLFSAEKQVTVAASSSSDVVVDVPLASGYRAIAVWQLNVGRSLALQGWAFRSSVTAQVSVAVRNMTSASVTQTVGVYLVCVAQGRFVP